MSRRLLLCVTLAATITVAGCTADTPTPPPPVPPTFDASALRLVAFNSCEQLTEDLRKATKEAVGPWGLPGDFAWPAAASAAGRPEGARAATDLNAAPAADQAATPEFSGTNVHEQGVDEPDMVKTDGKRIVTVSGGILRVVDAATRTETGKVSLDGQAYDGAELLLSGDKALVLLSRGYRGYAMDRRMADKTGGGPVLLLVDLAGEPRVVSRFEGEGELVDARQTGNVARVVLRSSPRISFPDQPNQNDEKKRLEANRKAVDKVDADAWLPKWTITTGSNVERGELRCGQVSRPPSYSGASMLSVHTFDLGAPALSDGDPVSVVADGDTVYGTGTSLYVASDQRWRFELRQGRADWPEAMETEIYRFDISGAGKPVYAAAGRIPGRPINQYAMSEWDGHLRVATTNEKTEKSAVRVLEQQGNKLAQVGVVDGLGKGERIYSVRFIGPRGYVVTFKQTDPLYSVDLRNPAKPKVTGELKITGYSSHLQPAGDGRLIGIGQEADTQGRVQGTQISYFDVSDPASPERLAQEHVSNGQSEAEYDPHALLYWPATNLLVVPITDYGPAAQGVANAAMAMRVTDRGIEKLGMVAQPRNDGIRPDESPGIRRSLVIGNTLWTVSDGGLQASDLSTLDQVGWVPND
jgi:uncharacterized secreted protein with C-terminal beta-propeller domain